MRQKTFYMVLSAIFAAITSICSIITIPLGFTPVPVNLGTMGMFLSGGLLGRKYGVISICVYIFMGFIGLPVFSGFRAGPGVLIGPTGGYIAGYVLGTFIIGLLIDKLLCKGNTIYMYALSLSAGMIVCYFIGTLWFVIITESTISAAIISCIVPFVAGDIIKIFISAVLIKRLRPFLHIY